MLEARVASFSKGLMAHPHFANSLLRLGAALTVALVLAPSPCRAEAATLPAQTAAPGAAALEAGFDAAFGVLMRGDFRAGLPLIEAVLLRSQSELGAGAAFTLKVHDYYAGTLLRMGRLADARREFELILARYRDAGTESSLGALSSLNNYANVIASIESPQAALPIFERALGLRSALVGEDHLESVTVLADYAWVLGETGRPHEALALLEQAVALRIKLQGERHSWTLSTLNSLGHLLSQLGRYADALAVHERVLRLRLAESGERHPSTLVSMSNTALMLKYLGRFEEARTLHQRAVELQTETLGRRHTSTLTSRRGLAGDLLGLGRLDEAHAALRELLDDSVLAHGVKHRHAQYTRLELALALERLKRPAEALVDVDTALAIHLEVAGVDHFNTLSAGLQRAHLLRLLGRTDEAVTALRDIHPRFSRLYGTAFPFTIRAAAELAACLEAQGELAQAEALLARLVDDAEALRAALPVGEDAALQQLNQQFGEAYRLRVRVLAGLGRLDEAFVMLERSKARSLLEQMSERGTALAAGVSVAQWDELRIARERAHALGSRLSEAKTPVERALGLDELQRASAGIARVQAALREQYPRYTRVSSLDLAGAGDGRLLPRDALFISYLLEGDGRLSAMTLDGQGRLEWHAMGQGQGLSDSIESLRLWSTQQGGKPSFQGDAGQPLEIVRWQAGDRPRWRVLPRGAAECTAEAAPGPCRPTGARVVWQRAEQDELRQALSERLLRPLQARLARHGLWVVSPDQALGLLPFDVLPWAGKRHLAAKVAVSQLQSLSVLRATRAAARPGSTGGLALLAIGNPDFGDAPAAIAGAETLRSARPRAAAWVALQRGAESVPAPGRSWPQLPASQFEMEQAAAQFRGQPTLVLSGREASEARLRRASDSGELAGARHLLLATHAWFDPEHPQASMLVLRGEGPAASEDGELSIGDITGLRMNSRLAVLSACNTARGDGRSGDGQFGFAYALNIAGNQNALLTMWPVLDRATADFVGRFFVHVARGVPHARALQVTKREFLLHPDPGRREPRYWAGFVLFGV